MLSGNADFSYSIADSESFAVTKSASLDVKIAGNEDGIDHGQDIFILALNPTVTLREQNANI